jgi:hypothetical protein
MNNIIPPKLKVDPTSYADGQKILFIKGIRAYTGMSLKEAKDTSEEQVSFVILRRRTMRDIELENKGIELIKQSGVTIISGGVQPIVDHLEEAVRAALEEGYYDVAADILNVLKAFK